MARAQTYTLLSLDRFAQLIGFDLLHFNQLTSALRPVGTCNDVLYQFNWQHPAQTGREEIANAIKQAEQDIAAYVNYMPLPTWIVDERQPTVKPSRRELFSTGYNANWQRKSVKTRYGHFVSGGMRAKTLVSQNANISYTDQDSDGFKETVTAQLATSVTDPCELHAYFPGENGADCWEIRPIGAAISAGVATLTMKRWQMVDPTAWEALDAEEQGAIDADDNANFITEIDVYRVYNNPAQQVQFLWEPGECGTCGGVGCAQCEFTTQFGCLASRDERLGNIMYRPATWNVDTLQFDIAQWAGGWSWLSGREPDKLRLWYYAGFRDNDDDCAATSNDPYFGTASDASCPTLKMHPYLERTIAMLALSYIQGDICDCTAVKTFFKWAQEDLTLQETTANLSISHNISQRVSACPWGTRRGQVEAFARMNAEGWKLPR